MGVETVGAVSFAVGFVDDGATVAGSVVVELRGERWLEGLVQLGVEANQFCLPLRLLSLLEAGPRDKCLRTLG